MHCRSCQPQHLLAELGATEGEGVCCELQMLQHSGHPLQRICTLQDFEPPSGDLKSAIEKDFGSVEDLSKKFNAKAATVQVCLPFLTVLSPLTASQATCMTLL